MTTIEAAAFIAGGLCAIAFNSAVSYATSSKTPSASTPPPPPMPSASKTKIHININTVDIQEDYNPRLVTKTPPPPPANKSIVFEPSLMDRSRLRKTPESSKSIPRDTESEKAIKKLREQKIALRHVDPPVRPSIKELFKTETSN